MRTGWRGHVEDIVLGVVIFLFGAWLYTDALSLAPGPGMFPRFVLGLITASGLGMVLVAVMSGIRGKETDFPETDWARIIGIPAIMLIAAGVLLYAFGFYVTSPLLILTVYLWHCRVSTGTIQLWRDPGVAVALAVGATLIMYLVFDRLIGLPAPAGAFL